MVTKKKKSYCQWISLDVESSMAVSWISNHVEKSYLVQIEFFRLINVCLGLKNEVIKVLNIVLGVLGGKKKWKIKF